MYKLDRKTDSNYQFKRDFNRYLVKSFLIGVGLLIGASIGLYYAVQNMPLPNQNTIYITGPMK